jgi:DNA-binding Xre family transcriptional regulator
MARIGKSNLGKTPANANTIIIDEKIYNSGADAMRTLGITSRQLHKMVLDGKARKTKTSKLKG